MVVGDGPERKLFEDKYPAVVFTGYLREDTYARALSSADVFVFPSLTDTFGLVMIEAMACGTPVAAFNVASPIDVVEQGVTGELDRDLSSAIARALKLDRNTVRHAAAKFTWERTAEMFESWLVPINGADAKQRSGKHSRRQATRSCHVIVILACLKRGMNSSPSDRQAWMRLLALSSWNDLKACTDNFARHAL